MKHQLPAYIELATLLREALGISTGHYSNAVEYEKYRQWKQKVQVSVDAIFTGPSKE